MSEPASPIPAIRLKGIGKTYRLYQKPAYRVLDLFGLCPTGPAFFGEHIALKDVDLEISRGEKVAIIGRNGAGKSTLLKIITGTITPTAGTMALSGQVSALLQIGTGFHPDFTGRQNVYSALAHQGITGARAHQLFDEIVDFAELHEYIDQPVKTYSTGMGARLMFSANTILSPDILVIDELLGVGDAYFSHKSYERMRRMCSDQGTTLLLVTHDLYTALNLCERFIWIDRGCVKMDCDGKTALTAYESSIKEQEEERLRRQHDRTLSQVSVGNRRLTIEFASASGFALAEPFAIGQITLSAGPEVTSELSVAVGAPGWELDPQGSLGPTTVIADRRCRCFHAFGSVFHKVSWKTSLPAGTAPQQIAVSWQYSGKDSVELRVFDDQRNLLLNDRLAGNGLWQTTTHSLVKKAAPLLEQKEGGHYGTGQLRISAVRFRGQDGTEGVRFRHAQRLTIEVEIDRISFTGSHATFTVAFHRPGVATAAYVNHDKLEILDSGRIRITAEISHLLLGAGQWLVTVGIAVPEHYLNPDNKYFSISDHWLHLIPRGFEIEIQSGSPIDKYAFVMLPATITVQPAPCPTSP